MVHAIPTQDNEMTQRRRIIIAPLVALVLASCAGGESTRQPSVWVADGPPVSCISTNQIRTYRVQDNRTVDFEMTGGRVFRNTLPFSCPDLTFGAGIRHNSRTSQLCSFDTITVVRAGMGPNPRRCQLGQFQPLKRVPVPQVPDETPIPR
jgi:Family of unknown function (DUF6491)